MKERVVSDRILDHGRLGISEIFYPLWLLVNLFLPIDNMHCSNSVMCPTHGTREVDARDGLNYKYANYDSDYYHLS